MRLPRPLAHARELRNCTPELNKLYTECTGERGPAPLRTKMRRLPGSPLVIRQRVWRAQPGLRKRPVLLRANFVLIKDRKRPYYGHFVVKYARRGLVLKRPGVLSKVQMLTLVLGVGVSSLLPIMNLSFWPCLWCSLPGRPLSFVLQTCHPNFLRSSSSPSLTPCDLRNAWL